MNKAIHIAQSILLLVDKQGGDTVSNLHLQRLLYFAQGHSLATYGKPIFNEQIIAQVTGPAVIEVRTEFIGVGDGSINYFELDKAFQDNRDPEVFRVVDDVMEHLYKYSATKLLSLIEDQPPYRDTKINTPLDLGKLQEYFKTLNLETL